MVAGNVVKYWGVWEEHFPLPSAWWILHFQLKGNKTPFLGLDRNETYSESVENISDSAEQKPIALGINFTAW